MPTEPSGLRPDVTPQAVKSLRLAADDMPISRRGQQWAGAAEWLRRRARAFEVALRDAPPARPAEQEIADALAEHRLSDGLRGDYEVPPYRKFITCTGCDWQHDIGGMSGWRSWIAAHYAEHVVPDFIAPLVARERAAAAAEALREAAGDMLDGAVDPSLWNHAACWLRDRADRLGGA